METFYVTFNHVLFDCLAICPQTDRLLNPLLSPHKGRFEIIRFHSLPYSILTLINPVTQFNFYFTSIVIYVYYVFDLVRFVN